jgi:hypothetical protein
MQKSILLTDVLRSILHFKEERLNFATAVKAGDSSQTCRGGGEITPFTKKQN